MHTAPRHPYNLQPKPLSGSGLRPPPSRGPAAHTSPPSSLWSPSALLREGQAQFPMTTISLTRLLPSWFQVMPPSGFPVFGATVSSLQIILFHEIVKCLGLEKTSEIFWFNFQVCMTRKQAWHG